MKGSNSSASSNSNVKLVHEFIELVRKLSYEKRQVTLASGRTSDFYIDMKNTLLHPRGIWLASTLIGECIQRRRNKTSSHETPITASHQDQEGVIKGIGGLTMGADPLSTGVSLISSTWKEPLYAFYIRKEPKSHGTQQWLEGLKNFSEGDSVVILEDVVTTGGSTLKSVERARMAGLNVVGVVSAVDREEGGAENILKENIWFESILTRHMIVEGVRP